MNLSEVKPNMHKKVIFDGSVYLLSKCIMWLDEKDCEFKYSLVLIDKNNNSAINAPIEKVEVIK